MTEGDVFTGKSQTEVLMYWPNEYIKAEAWGFPCNDRTDEVINKLLYGLFSAIFKKNTIKKHRMQFWTSACARFVAHTKKVSVYQKSYPDIFFQLWKRYFHFFSYFLFISRPR